MRMIACTFQAHAEAILAILNEAIVNTTALYDYQPRTIAYITAWFAAKEAGGFPVLGVVDNRGELLGFASYGVFRAWPAYKYSVEHSLYIRKDRRGQGIGKSLLSELIAKAREQQYHTLIGGIDATNVASIKLHQQAGFVHAGTVLQAGFKFGRWLDLAFYQLILDTPLIPVDG